MPEAVDIVAIERRTAMRLKSWLPAFTTGGERVTLAGRELPSQVGARLSGDVRFLCIGPGEWLVVSAEIDAPETRERIAPDLARQGLVLTDLSDALAGFQVSGPAA